MERFLLLGLVQALLMLLKRRVTKQWLHFEQQLGYFLGEQSISLFFWKTYSN
jgi:hypothetical protein